MRLAELRAVEDATGDGNAQAIGANHGPSHQSHTESRDHDTGLNSRRRRPTEEDITEITEITVDVIGERNQSLVEVRNLLNYKDPSGRRSAPRVMCEVIVVVFTSAHSFRTRTVNISLSGVLLKEALPTTFAGEALDIVFIAEQPENNHTNYFLLHGRAVSGGKPTRLQFTMATHRAFKALQTLLENPPLRAS
ncbi:MAG: hypothetical protein C5B49_05320 [Bdellovibrio sp.]|nr:MAG: hypothetical protein C5B49_05320 [Bdellovibrio sp.]